MGEPGLYGERLWRGGTAASVREGSMAQIRTDSPVMSSEAGATYFYCGQS